MIVMAATHVGGTANWHSLPPPLAGLSISRLENAKDMFAGTLLNSTTVSDKFVDWVQRADYELQRT